ncbi:MAG: hypothetical protein KBS59_07605 [Clostridiales bacterium]|nr:hypothetical protein [Clostridiales bacterium]
MAVLIISIIEINKKLDPLVCDIAEEQIKNSVSQTISKTLKDYDFSGDYVSIERDGKDIKSIGANTALLNLVQADIVSRISSELDGTDEYKVYVSYSNLFDDEVILGKFDGLYIPAGVLPVRSVRGEIKTEFQSAGINQTRYRISLVLHVDINAVLLISTVEISMDYEIAICDTVIIGNVPEVYLYGE